MSTPQSPAHGEPPVVELPAFTILGISARTSNANEMSGNSGLIGPLWHRFITEAAATIPTIDPATVYSVYTNYETDETGEYDVVIGKSADPQDAASGLTRLSIPAQRYLTFNVNGGTPEDIRDAWMSVYTYFASHLQAKRAFTADFERYGADRPKLFIAVR